jgi:hypothetical protein
VIKWTILKSGSSNDRSNGLHAMLVIAQAQVTDLAEILRSLVVSDSLSALAHERLLCSLLPTSLTRTDWQGDSARLQDNAGWFWDDSKQPKNMRDLQPMAQTRYLLCKNRECAIIYSKAGSHVQIMKVIEQGWVLEGWEVCWHPPVIEHATPVSQPQIGPATSIFAWNSRPSELQLHQGALLSKAVSLRAKCANTLRENF